MGKKYIEIMEKKMKTTIAYWDNGKYMETTVINIIGLKNVKLEFRVEGLGSRGAYELLTGYEYRRIKWKRTWKMKRKLGFYRGLYEP